MKPADEKIRDILKEVMFETGGAGIGVKDWICGFIAHAAALSGLDPGLRARVVRTMRAVADKLESGKGN